MTVDEALRILRNLWGHTERRRQCAADAMAGHIDAMNLHIKDQAAQIEALQRNQRVVQSAAQAIVAHKDAQHERMTSMIAPLSAAAADVAGERAANALLTDENERLRAQIEALTKDAERWLWWREQIKDEKCRIAAQAMLWNINSRSALDAATDAAIKAKEAK